MKRVARDDMFGSNGVASALPAVETDYVLADDPVYKQYTGFVSQALKNGVGETVKEGSPLVSIVPTSTDLAVEIFVEPIDLPLVHVGNKVRIQFDGWPAIVFSGWPNVSYGTYGGKIFAIDNYIGSNGKYRVLVEPDTTVHKWPKGLRLGVAVQSMTLLKDVPIWYELWRNINGFPADYYRGKTAKKEKNEK
jgi:hypothetical protein